MRLRRYYDKLSAVLLRIPVIATVGTLVMITCALYLRSRPLLEQHSLWQCLSGDDWHPLRGAFGLLPFITGTAAVTGLAIVLAVPVSLLGAIYLSDYASRRTRELIRPVIDVMAAIPSIIYGICGILFIVPLVRFTGSALGRPTTGYTLLSAGIVLAVMIMPIISAVSIEVMESIPLEAREAPIALGATRWETIRHIVLRKARPGIMAAIMLGLSRAFGETMAVMMVAGNVPNITASLFKPVYTLPSLIANNYGEMFSIPLYDAALMLAALILLIVIAAVNIGAHAILQRLNVEVTE